MKSISFFIFIQVLYLQTQLGKRCPLNLSFWWKRNIESIFFLHTKQEITGGRHFATSISNFVSYHFERKRTPIINYNVDSITLVQIRFLLTRKKWRWSILHRKNCQTMASVQTFILWESLLRTVTSSFSSNKVQ